MELYSFIDCICGGCVADNASDIKRKLAGRNLTACDSLQKLLFISLRIFHLQRLDGNWISLLFSLGAKELHSIHLVHLHTEDDMLWIYSLGSDHCSFKKSFRLLHHKAVVAGDVGLALHSVYYQVLNLLSCGDRELYGSGEGGSTHSYYSHFLHQGLDLLASHLLPVIG